MLKLGVRCLETLLTDSKNKIQLTMNVGLRFQERWKNKGVGSNPSEVEARASNRNNKSEYGGALWDIFRREDVPKLHAYLQTHWNEFRYIMNKPLEEVVHPIHDQTIYLNVEHKRKLKEEFQVEPWKFEQHLGEAVFIPVDVHIKYGT